MRSKIEKKNLELYGHGAIRTHKSLVPKTNALTIRPRGRCGLMVRALGIYKKCFVDNCSVGNNAALC